jgi:hypothetical protein
MNRSVRLLIACLALSVAACGDDESVSITLFQAAPDSIDPGQSTKLLFAVDPPDAQVNIAGIGDVTGKTEAVVSPLSTTVYQLTAKAGVATTTGSVTVTVSAAVPRIELTIPADANAGYPVSVGVAVKDQFGRASTGYTGTVTFEISDTGAGAVAPAPITFNGTEGGVATTTVTFITRGTQTLNAGDNGTPVVKGTVSSTVRGLVYTPPTSGRVRLIANAAQSNAHVIQLDLVANERLEMSSFFNSGGQPGGPGSFAAGMNLPLDTTRVMADTTLFTRGPALPAGTGTPASIGVIGTDHILYTAVSRKRTPAAIFTQATEVQAGGVFFSVRLKLTPTGTVGSVFDGAQPAALFRAAVRDQFGDDFVNQSEFGIGTLEIR